MSISSSLSQFNTPNKVLLRSQKANMSDGLVKKLREDYEEAKVRAEHYAPTRDVAIHQRIHRQLASRIYSALSSLLYASISMTKVDELERFILKRASGLPKALFDLNEWADVIDLAKQCRNHNFERIELMSSPLRHRGLLRDDITVESSMFESFVMPGGMGNNNGDSLVDSASYRRVSDPGVDLSLPHDGTPHSPAQYTATHHGGRAVPNTATHLVSQVKSELKHSNMGTSQRLLSGAIGQDLKDFGDIIRRAQNTLSIASLAVVSSERARTQELKELRAELDLEREEKNGLYEQLVALRAATDPDQQIHAFSSSVTNDDEFGKPDADIQVLVKEQAHSRERKAERSTKHKSSLVASEEAFEHERNQLKKEITMSEQLHATRDEELAQLQKTRQLLADDVNTLQVTLVSRDEEVSRLQEQLTGLVAAGSVDDTLQKTLASRDEAMAQLEKNLASRDEEVARLKVQVVDLTTAVEMGAGVSAEVQKQAKEAEVAKAVPAVVVRTDDTAVPAAEVAAAQATLADETARLQAEVDTLRAKLARSEENGAAAAAAAAAAVAAAATAGAASTVAGKAVLDEQTMQWKLQLKNQKERYTTRIEKLEVDLEAAKKDAQEVRVQSIADAEQNQKQQQQLVPVDVQRSMSGTSDTSEWTDRECAMQKQTDNLMEALVHKEAAMHSLAATVAAAEVAATQAQAAASALVHATHAEDAPGSADADSIGLRATKQRLAVREEQWDEQSNEMRVRMVALEGELAAAHRDIYRLSSRLKSARAHNGKGSPFKTPVKTTPGGGRLGIDSGPREGYSHDEAVVLMMQSAARRYLATKRVSGIKCNIVAQNTDTIVAYPGTVQGESGWYLHGEDLFYFVVVGDGPEDFRMLCGPVGRATVDEAAREACLHLERSEGFNFDGHGPVGATTRLPRDVCVDLIAVEASRLSIQELQRRVSALENEIVATKGRAGGGGGGGRADMPALTLGGGSSPPSFPPPGGGGGSIFGSSSSMPDLTPRSSTRVVKLQARARGFIAKASVDRIRTRLAAQHLGVLVAMRNTVQGHIGWYGAPDGHVYYMVPNEGSWRVVCGPISPFVFTELEDDCNAMRVSRKSLRGHTIQEAPFNDPCAVLRRVTFTRTDAQDGAAEAAPGSFLVVSKKSQRLFVCNPVENLT
jgi:hypothetical protein